MRRQLVWATLCAGAVTLAACSSGGDTAPSTTGAAGTTTGPAPTVTTTQPDDEPMTLADFLGGTDDPELASLSREERIEESIRACMTLQGFTYVPAVNPAFVTQMWTPEEEDDYARTWGWGISTTFEREEEHFRLRWIDPDDWVDPNLARVEAMSEGERAAWDTALEGDGADVPGCRTEAYEIEAERRSEQLWEDLQPSFNEMHERLAADPRLVALDKEWAECMTGRGFGGFTDQGQAWMDGTADLQQRYATIVGAEYIDPFSGWAPADVETFQAENTSDEIQAFHAETRDRLAPAVDRAALTALQQEEIDMAVAYLECGQELGEAYMEVYAPYEAEFISENLAVLELIREERQD